MLFILGSILAIQTVYVSCFTLRMILTLKGEKYTAAAISMLEIFILRLKSLQTNCKVIWRITSVESDLVLLLGLDGDEMAKNWYWKFWHEEKTKSFCMPVFAT